MKMNIFETVNDLKNKTKHTSNLIHVNLLLGLNEVENGLPFCKRKETEIIHYCLPFNAERKIGNCGETNQDQLRKVLKTMREEKD